MDMIMQCPLCKQELLEIYEGPGAEKDYICRVRVTFEGSSSISHYELREGDLIRWFVPPYQICFNYGKTIVSKIHHYEYSTNFIRPQFKHVFTVDGIIHPDTPEKLLARIKLLTIMS